MEEKYVCSVCGEEYGREDLIEFDGDLLCSDCLDNETTVCSRCGERIWTNDNEGDDQMPLCSRCYDYYYTTCEDCGRVISIDDAYYDDEDSDTPYCCSCHERRQSQIHIHDYGYKPDPIFYGAGNRFFGIELEIDGSGKDEGNAEIIENTANYSDELIYIKSDGSLDEGLEIVTHPMTLDFHMNHMPWQNVMNKALELGYMSHKTTTCGLHIHTNRTCFGEDYEQQEDCISRVLFFVERFWQELLKFSRRTESSIKRWAARYGIKDKPKDVMDTAKKGYGGRYTCVNITNYSTVEFRIFRGTLRYTTLIATLQLVNEICDVALFMSDDELGSLSWPEFVSRIDEKKNPELIKYLKERRLYVNEPVVVGEEEK